MWRQIKEEQKVRRQSRRESFQDDLELFKERMPDVEVKALTSFQFRFIFPEVKIDIYPSNRRYHNITTQERGGYGDLFNLLERETRKQPRKIGEASAPHFPQADPNDPNFEDPPW